MLYLISQVYNEEKRIKQWLESLLKCVDGAFIVNDGSVDKTRDILYELAIGQQKLWICDTEHEGYDKHHMRMRDYIRQIDSTAWIIRLDVDEEINIEDLLKIKMTYISQCNQQGYDSIRITMKDFVDGRFIRDEHKTRIFKNEDYIVHPCKIHTEEIGFKNTLFVPSIIINHKKTKAEVLGGTELILKHLKNYLDAFELTWHRTREMGFDKEFDEMLHKNNINVKV